MARAVEVFKNNAIAANTAEAQRQEYEVKSAAEKQFALDNMANTVESELGRAVVDISMPTARMVANAEQMANAAHSVGANSVAAAAEKSLANAQIVATASEQLSCSIEEI